MKRRTSDDWVWYWNAWMETPEHRSARLSAQSGDEATRKKRKLDRRLVLGAVYLAELYAPTEYISDQAVIRKFVRLGKNKFLLAHNRKMFLDAQEERKRLLKVIKEYTGNPAVTNPSQIKLMEFERWIAVGVRWFEDKGYDLPAPPPKRETKQVEQPQTAQADTPKAAEEKQPTFARETREATPVVIEKVVVAPFKYKITDFEEVDRLILEGCTQKGALDKVCEDHKFSSREGFEKQWRKYFNRKGKRK